MPGFIRLVTPQDIPPGGTNNCVSTSGMYEPEQVSYSYECFNWSCWLDHVTSCDIMSRYNNRHDMFMT